MRGEGARAPLAIVSSSWGGAGEIGFAVRSIAGAASRVVPVDVFVPGTPAARTPDGAFDLSGVGRPVDGGRWPDAADVAPASRRYGAVAVEEADPGAVAIARALAPGAPVVVIGSGSVPLEGSPAAEAAAVLGIGASASTSGAQRVGAYVAVNPFASSRPHLELGAAVDYILVLSDRGPDTPDADRPSDDVAWLVARFPRRHVVVVENAVAVVWRSRSASRQFGVHTRMDLWRLMAHARATVDLAPGSLFARECVEALRFGVPIIAPSATQGAGLAELGGGLAFSGTRSLLGCVAAMETPLERDRLAAAGRAVADEWYGSPAALVERVAAALGALHDGAS